MSVVRFRPRPPFGFICDLSNAQIQLATMKQNSHYVTFEVSNSSGICFDQLNHAIESLRSRSGPENLNSGLI